MVAISTSSIAAKLPPPEGAARECPMCRAGAARFLGAKNGFTLFRCGACGFLYLDPMPAAEDFDRLYGGDEGTAIESYPKAASRRRRGFIKAAKYLRYIRGRDVLDVGCGGGFVVEAMRRVGARAAGIDPHAPSIEYARRAFPACEFHCGVAEDLQASGRKFDFLYCSEVIEHVPDAEGFTAALARLCRPGGYLFVTTPDIGHWRVPKDLISWDLVDPPQHVRYFTIESLRMLLERHGFALRRKIFKVKPGLQVLAERR